MILRVTAKSLALLLGTGVVSSHSSHLRGRRRMSLFHRGPDGAAATTVEASTVATPQLWSDPGAMAASASAGSNNDVIKDEYKETDEEEYEREYEIEEEEEEEEENEEEEEEEEENEEEEEEEEEEAGSLAADKYEYAHGDVLSLQFSVPPAARTQKGDDLSQYRVGIFMRVTDLQAGAHVPLLSLPLCAAREGCDARGTVTFGPDSVALMGDYGGWPLNLIEWGTVFDAYVLDGSGEDVVGPAQFNIVMDDTY